MKIVLQSIDKRTNRYCINVSEMTKLHILPTLSIFIFKISWDRAYLQFNSEDLVMTNTKKI